MTIPAPSARNPGVKPALDRIVMRALARDPDKRYQWARDMGDELEALVVRERYSTRMFAKKARELAVDPNGTLEGSRTPREGSRRAELVGTHANPPDAPVSLGQKDVEIIAAVDQIGTLEGSRAPREGSRRAKLVGTHATPPRPPPPRATVAAAPASHARWKWIGIAAAVPVAVAVIVLIAVSQHGAGVTAANATPPVAVPPTIQLSLDSLPQGATVNAVGGDGRRLGETPLVLELPRGRTPVELILTRPGFAPLTFKVIPNHDKDALARLEPIPQPVAEAPPRRRSSAGTSRTARDELMVPAKPAGARRAPEPRLAASARR